MLSHPFRILVALFLVLFLVAAQPCAHAQAGFNGSEEQYWYRAYLACFDKQHYLFRHQMQQFVFALQQEHLQTPSQRNSRESAYFFLLLAYGQAELGDWKDAEQANLQVVRIAPTYHDTEQAYENLTGIYAVQRQWPRAITSFGHWIGNDLLHLAGPKFLVCLAWLILWQLGTDIPSRPRISRRALPLLVVFALCPLFSVVFETVAICLNSYLFTGNAGTAIVSTRTSNWVNIAVGAEWGMSILLLAYWVRKHGWIARAAPDASPAASEAKLSLSRASAIRKHVLRSGKYLAMVCLGILLLGAILPSPMSYLTILQHWSHYVTILRRGDTVDLLWCSGLLNTAVFGPFAEEVLYRGTIYVYARQVGGTSFGLVFSSLVFASEHIDKPNYFVLYVMWGIIFATQYEVSQRLAPSTATHMIVNFFSYISRLS